MKRKIKIASALLVVSALTSVVALPAQAAFTSEKYPATITGTSTKDAFHMFGSTVTCTENTFSGTLAGGSETLPLTASYNNCTAFGLPATVNFTGCELVPRDPWGFGDTVIDIICPAGKHIDIKIYSSSAHLTVICHVGVPGQLGKGAGHVNLLLNSGKIVMNGKVPSIAATQVRTSIACPVGTETTSATYTIQSAGIEFSGNNGALSID